MKFIAALAILFVCISGCRPDEEVTPLPGHGDVVFEIEHKAGDQPLEFGVAYRNAMGDTLIVNAYKYYISNVKFVKENGEEYAVPESYYFINHADPSSMKFLIEDIPAGTYTKVKVTLGVDSLRNVSGAQTGALDPANGMFWTWSTGYIMAKIEGSSPQSGMPGGAVFFHLGGFSGEYNSVKECEFPLSAPVSITANNTSSTTFTFKSDILKWFYGENLIDFSLIYSVMTPGPEQKRIAENYAKSFELVGVE